MANPSPLPPEKLFRRCAPEQLDFETTDDLEDLDVLLGQERAVSAIAFAVGMRHESYNVYALGPSGTGKHMALKRLLAPRAEAQPPGSDWCYVNNFEEANRPRALRLPAGVGAKLRADMTQFAQDLEVAIPAALESDDYQRRRRAIDEEFKELQQKAFESIQEEAEAKGLAIMRTPVGLLVLPERDGETLSPEAFQELPDSERATVEGSIEEVQGRLQAELRHAPHWERQRRNKVRELNEDVITFAVRDLLKPLRKKYKARAAIMAFLDAIDADVADSLDDFIAYSRSAEESGGDGMARIRALATNGDPFRRYQVNLLVDRATATGAALVYEDNPTLPNLVGRVDHRSIFGLLSTDFMLVRAGALHRANGGYLVLDARQVLTNPFVWDELKRALRSREVRIETPAQLQGALSTVSLEPEPIPLEVRVLLVGEREVYHLLAALDPQFRQLFKVAADFDVRMDREDAELALFARHVATRVREEGLRPFRREAVARVIEQASRLADDSEKLSTHLDSLVDLLREADYCAAMNEQTRVRREDVQGAIDAASARDGRVRERLQEEIRRGTLRIDTAGAQAGQINGLSVSQIGRFAFGHPVRISARVRLGKGDVVDIEREVQLGGPIHSKGVLILSGFLGARYAQRHPLALGATLVFEQSYGGVDGDSASLAELCALLSAIANVPLRQRFAVTGSVDQHGRVQAVGGVNEKIEGFFDVCKARGLADHGVLLPASNAKHLMLRDDIVEAARQGTFSVYPIEGVDEALALLTGLRAGEPDGDGVYPEGSVNRRVADRLAELADTSRQFLRAPRPAPGESS